VFQFVLIASGPVTGQHLLFAPYLQVFIHIDKIALNLLFYRLSSPSSLSLSSSMDEFLAFL